MNASRKISSASIFAGSRAFLCLIAALMLPLAFAPLALAEVTVALRGNAEPITGIGAVAALRGLEVQQPGTKGSVIIPWDLVRSVDGATIVGLEGELAVGQDLWRGRIRVERGDEALAEPLLAKYWERYRLQDGPTTAVVAEGLLRCALARQDLRAAVEPWFVCLRIGSNGEPSRFPEMPGVLDDTTGLLPELSPFLPESRRAELTEALASVAKPGTGDAATAGIAAECAARLARMLSATEPNAAFATATDPGRDAAPSVRALGLIEAILTAPDRRSADRAVAEFERALPDPPGYLGAWKLAAAGTQAARLARAAVGDGRGRALEEAAVALLAVPASGLDKTGLVDAYALEEAVTLLKDAGDMVSSVQVRAVLDERLRDAAGGKR